LCSDDSVLLKGKLIPVLVHWLLTAVENAAGRRKRLIAGTALPTGEAVNTLFACYMSTTISLA
jgi:hypothetical protein